MAEVWENTYLEKLSVFVSGFKKPVWNWIWNIFIEVICKKRSFP